MIPIYNITLENIQHTKLCRYNDLLIQFTVYKCILEINIIISRIFINMNNGKFITNRQ